MKRAPRAVLAAISIGVGACGMITGVDGDYHTVMACEDTGRQCVPSAPPGFIGPIVLSEEETTTATCPPDFPFPVNANGLVFAGLVAEPASCKCECVAPAGACKSALLTLHDGPDCGNATPQELLVTETDCKPFGVPAGKSAQLTFTKPTECQPKPTANVPEHSWNTRYLGCKAPRLEATCEVGDCVPPLPSGARSCVFRVGDVECPAPTYSEKSVYYTDVVDDDRGCSECECGPPSGGCGDQIGFFDTACSGTPNSTPGADECFPPSAGTANVKYSAKPTLTCAPSGGEPIGSATPVEPVTLCCAPPS